MRTFKPERIRMIAFLENRFEQCFFLRKKKSPVTLVTGCGFCRDAFTWIEIRGNVLMNGTVLQRNIIIIFIVRYEIF